MAPMTLWRARTPSLVNSLTSSAAITGRAVMLQQGSEPPSAGA